MGNTSKSETPRTAAILSKVTESKQRSGPAASREDTRVTSGASASKTSPISTAGMTTDSSISSKESFDPYNTASLAVSGNAPVQVIFSSNPTLMDASDDLMFLWSDIFESSQRSHDDDLFSILSLDVPPGGTRREKE